MINDSSLTISRALYKVEVITFHLSQYFAVVGMNLTYFLIVGNDIKDYSMALTEGM